MTLTTERSYVRAASMNDIADEGSLVVEVEGQTIALFKHEGRVYAIDNRCPHMGFPLHQGSLECGILTCDWHHARFDLASGGTFHPWADDVRAYPLRIENGDIWIDMAATSLSTPERLRNRLAGGLKQNLRLIIAKAVLGLHAADAPAHVAVTEGALFGTRLARNGWGSGLTILTCMANILPTLKPEDRPRALYHGLTQVANQTAGQSPAISLEPLPDTQTDADMLKRWFRQFIEIRNRDGAERTLRTAIAQGVPMPVVADMVFAAATDHLYLGGGHAFDFANKAFEMLDLIGWQHAPDVLASVVPALTGGARSEEQSNWRHPIDVAQQLHTAFENLPALVEQGANTRAQHPKKAWTERNALVKTLLQDDPTSSIHALQAALAAGAEPEQLASAVAFAAARRIAHFRASNEFDDWITVLHTFTYANAVHQAMRRAPSVELLRGVFDGAISVYLNRFLNKPPAPLPLSASTSRLPLEALLDTMNTQQQISEAARQVADHLADGGDPDALLATLGHALLREDAEFHTFQMVEAGFRQFADLRGTEDGRIMLIAIARYLAAHAPTARATGQTYLTALRLHRGENLYAE